MWPSVAYNLSATTGSSEYTGQGAQRRRLKAFDSGAETTDIAEVAD